jgi:hypothetical protein
MSARLMVSSGVQHVTYNGVLLVFKLLRSAQAFPQSDFWSHLKLYHPRSPTAELIMS